MNTDDQVDAMVASGDTQGAAIVMSMLELEAELDSQGWDQPARLWTLRRDLPPTELADALRDDIGVAVQLMSTTMVAPLMGDGGDMAHAMRYLAARLPRVTPKPMPDLMAWLLSHEAWMAEAPKGDAQASAAIQADADAHRLHQRPDRIEVRMVMAVDRTGTWYEVMRRRGSPPEAFLPDRAHYEGRLVEALLALMDATP